MSRHKIIWSEDSLKDYELLVSRNLPRLRKLWQYSESEVSISILLETTNMILSQAAILTNRSVLLSSKKSSKSSKIPASVKKSNKSLARFSETI